MIKQVYLDSRIDKHLDRLKRSGKKAAMAATKAEDIISRLQDDGIIPDRVGTVTKHGELRIKGVMKYDLGGGYRLVTFKHGLRFFLLFIGSHDDCHRWIENNRELTPDQIEDRCTPLVLPGPSHDPADSMDAIEIEEDEWDPLASVDEQTLRRVFCGLVGGE
ncbi:MAG: hypothetical protein P8X55_17350 [Desulfosarcinaceae bacterium]